MWVVFIVCLVAIGLVFGPCVTIWALNTLFNLHIPVTMSTWFAALWLGIIVYGATK